MRVLVLLAALLAAAALGSCGASDPAGGRWIVRAHASVSHPRTVREAISGALLSRDALGPAWSAERSAPPVSCPAVDPWRDAALKLTSPLLRQGSVAVGETIAALRTPALAREVGRRLASLPAQACFERALKAEIAARQGYRKFGPMVSVRHETDAQRSTIRVQTEYGDVLTCIDQIRVTAGVLIADTVVISGPEPIQESLYEHLVSLATSRVRYAAGAVWAFRGRGEAP